MKIKVHTKIYIHSKFALSKLHMRPRRSVIRARRAFGCLVSVLGTCDSGCDSSCDSGYDFWQDPGSVLRTCDCGCDPGCDFGCDCCCVCDSGCRFDCDYDFECDLNVPLTVLLKWSSQFLFLFGSK